MRAASRFPSTPVLTAKRSTRAPSAPASLLRPRYAGQRGCPVSRCSPMFQSGGRRWAQPSVREPPTNWWKRGSGEARWVEERTCLVVRRLVRKRHPGLVLTREDHWPVVERRGRLSASPTREPASPPHPEQPSPRQGTRHLVHHTVWARTSQPFLSRGPQPPSRPRCHHTPGWWDRPVPEGHPIPAAAPRSGGEKAP